MLIVHGVVVTFPQTIADVNENTAHNHVVNEPMKHDIILYNKVCLQIALF